MSKSQTHYLPDGKVYTGATHKAGKTLMTGEKHTKTSKVLKHTKPKQKGAK
jgi:hypothetical protein